MVELKIFKYKNIMQKEQSDKKLTLKIAAILDIVNTNSIKQICVVRGFNTYQVELA